LALIISCTVFADESKVSISYQGNSQFEIICPNGVRVFTDVYDPSLLSAPPTPRDILLTTHTSVGNFLESFSQSFPGKQLTQSDGEILQDGLHILAIAGKHHVSDKLGTNYMFLIETAGLRIVHFGDIGQERFSDQQLTCFGKVDIALTQFYNTVSNIDSVNLTGFNLMDQIHPKMIIPTNLDIDTAKYAVKKWRGYYWDRPMLKVGSSDMQGKTELVFMGPRSKQYGRICKVPIRKD
jgi:hypothetical protein